MNHTKDIFEAQVECPFGPLSLWFERDEDGATYPIWLAPKYKCPEIRQRPAKGFLKRLGSHQVYHCDTPAVIQSWFDDYFSAKQWTSQKVLRLYGTLFQQQVWLALAQIPFGEQLSYADLAGKLSCPTAVRAVAGAVGANPLPILLPCHRVVYHNGGVGGFALGLEWKARLLAHEGWQRQVFDLWRREDS